MKIEAGLTAVITGGASGLGAATARALAERGVKVGLIDRDKELGETLAREIGAEFAEADVTDQRSITEALGSLREKNGQERVLVNCAGVGDAIKTVSRNRKTGAIEPHPMDRFIRTIDINLIGTFRVLALSAAGMMELEPLDEGERGVIINTASVAATDGQMGQVAYAASKAAIAGMALPIARDFHSEGIRVNTIMPGIFETPLLMGSPQHVIDALGASVPFPKRLGRPHEYAALAISIIENPYLNGEQIRLDGAIRMAMR